ncbi:MAG: cytidine deaminase [Hyphomicrobiales bacterium]|nr:cytidine deaminase [Hyphomicrobiales bacterium]
MRRARSTTSKPKLGHSLKLLFDAAMAARAQAYAPYSRFPVGAALRSREGAVFAGCNVENASYPLVTCAEAGAIAAMIAAGHKGIAEFLVFGGGEKVVTPCGACRQRLREFAGPEVLVHCMSPSGGRVTYSVGALLPAAFGPEHLAQEELAQEE